MKLNPNGVVPTLDHDGKIVTESNIIIEYLDDTFPQTPLKPDDTYQTAIMRLWLDAAELQIHKNVNIVSYNKRHVPRMSKLFSKDEQREILMRYPSPEKRAVMLNRLEFGVSGEDELFAIQRLNDVMKKIEKTLNDNKWLAGDKFSLADIAVAPFIERFEANKMETLIDWDKRPRTADWWDRVQSRESYKTTYAFQNPDT